jgi:hypothetical protein
MASTDSHDFTSIVPQKIANSSKTPSSSFKNGG